MKTARAVIGANFGDEGKGKIVDYLSGPDTVVVRHNGGAQAGHTVVAGGARHVFHHFGSGTLAGAATALGPSFIVNPILFMRELAELRALGVEPEITIPIECRVTTPYEMMLNQAVETSRGAQRHGSCGIGINETVERESNGVSFDGEDLIFSDCRRLLKRLAETWVPRRAAALNVPVPVVSDEIIERFVADCDAVGRYVACVLRRDRVIYEGAQGLLLDQDNKDFFPHVTRSHTGIYNASRLAFRAGYERLHVTYVTRPYLTRHGAGRLPNECALTPPWPGIRDETNVSNDWQGGLRFGFLDIAWLAERLADDRVAAKGIIDVTAEIALTCTDQMPDTFDWLVGHNVRTGTVDQIITSIETYTTLPVRIIGTGPARDDVRIREHGEALYSG